MEYSKLTVENCRKIVSSCVTWDEEVHQAQCLQMQKNLHGEKMAELEMMVGFNSHCPEDERSF